jgi:hypothetical protein
MTDSLQNQLFIDIGLFVLHSGIRIVSISSISTKARQVPEIATVDENPKRESSPV